MDARVVAPIGTGVATIGSRMDARVVEVVVPIRTGVAPIGAGWMLGWLRWLSQSGLGDTVWEMI